MSETPKPKRKYTRRKKVAEAPADPTLRWHDIHGWFDYADLYSSIVEWAQDGDILVEVGSWLGRSSAYMAGKIKESGKKLKFYCVDTWEGEKDQPAHKPTVDAHGGSIFNAWRDNMKACGVFDVITPIIGDSAESASYFTDGSVAFVFIDAAHDYQSVKKDILAWLPKLSAKGRMAGHDYGWPEVYKAVHELLDAEMCSYSAWRKKPW